MRLLEFDGQGELNRVRSFHEDNIPPYAILSHTWGAEEVTLYHLQDESYKHKAGYSKIRFCGEQAQKDNLLYFWVDTCCIIRTSSTELTQAINSMFRWYRNAVKCYVYLSDVSVRDEDDNHTNLTWEMAFRKSRWFTRGWTLQELLAPASVEFFSREGTLLGNKKTLEGLIHEITTIPITALRGEPLAEFDVDERLRWASKRKTTRKEDEAYCLIGIFDVSMPLLYGEGENAFHRLRDEILRVRSPEQLRVQSAQCIPADTPRKDSQNDRPLTDSGYDSIPNLHYSMDGRVPLHESPDANDSGSSDTVGDTVAQDSETQYSAATSVAPDEVQHYVVELCNEILHSLGRRFDALQWSSLSRVLPELIKAFAIMIGYESSNPVNQEIMYFIHSQNKNIATELYTFQLEDIGSDSSRETTDVMSLNDKMRLWENKAGTDHSNPENDDELFTGVEDVEDALTELTDLPRYNNIILDSAAYKWFLASLQKRLALQWSGTQPCVMIDDIRRKILDQLPTGRISKRRVPRAYRVEFDLEWTSEMEQNLLRRTSTTPNGSEEFFPDLITITGAPEEAQVLTIKQYLDQTWPVGGLQLLEVIKDTISSHDCHVSVTFPDNTQLDATIDRFCLIITATGPPVFIAECGEQLSWLGAAVQHDSQRAFNICTASVVKRSVEDLNRSSTRTKHLHRYKLWHDLSSTWELERSVSKAGEYCQGLVGKSVLILGFPITRRPEGYSGLEVSFETLLKLLEAKEASLKNGMVVVKGRKATLWLAKHTDAVYLWHHFYELTENGTACMDGCTGRYHDGIDLRSLEIGRHILGKCMEFPTAGTTTKETGFRRYEDPLMCREMGFDGLHRTPSISRNENTKPSTQLTTTFAATGANPSYDLRPFQDDESHSLSIEPANDKTVSRSFSIGAVVDSNPGREGPRLGKIQLERLATSSVSCLSAVDRELDTTAGSPDDSLDSDVLSLSDSSEDSGPLEFDGRAHEFLNIVLNRLLSGFHRNIRDCSGRGQKQGASAGSPSAAGSSESRSNPGLPQKRTGRRQGDGNGHDDTGKDDPSMPPPKKAKVSHEQMLNRSLACPYLKLDPVKHRQCCVNKHSRIRDVKQHLHRRHTPLRYCQRCFDTSFADEESLKSHVDTGTCPSEDPTILDGISYEKRWQLSRKSKAGLNEQEQWFAIWELLFPGRCRPNSPYLNTDLSLEMREFREYCLHHGPALLREQIQSELSCLPPILNTDQQQAALDRLIGQGMITLFERWHWRVSPPALRLLGSDPQSIPHNTSTGSIADSGVVLESQPSPQEAAAQRFESSQPFSNLDFESQAPSEAIDLVHPGRLGLPEDLSKLGRGHGENLIGNADDIGATNRESLEDPFETFVVDYDVEFTNDNEEVMTQTVGVFDSEDIFLGTYTHPNTPIRRRTPISL